MTIDTPITKDGKIDKRYKQNETRQKLKKDGTRDRRTKLLKDKKK